ncbi:MAG: hypothetical protein D6820_08170 [Lentisphaerae bacterium]|nr:MAG: hypothetical protein D6820_08170 [Lentisphaerota bacterium]
MPVLIIALGIVTLLVTGYFLFIKLKPTSIATGRGEAAQTSEQRNTPAGTAEGPLSPDITPHAVAEQPSAQRQLAAAVVPDFSKPPRYQVGVLSDKGTIKDVIVAPDQSVIVCGETASAARFPDQVKPILLGGKSLQNKSGFLARISPQLDRILWLAVFGDESFFPDRLVILSHGRVVCSGVIGKNYALIPQLAQQSFKKTQAAIIAVDAKSPKILWCHKGSPNQNKITGLARDRQGRILWTGFPRVRGAANYVQRITSDGGESPFAAVPTKDGIKESWAIYLAPKEWQLNQPGQYMSFYNKAKENGGYYDYDGPGKWGPVSWGIEGLRIGGQIVVLPNGDFVVSCGLQYSFRVKGQKRFPAFDAFLARYRPDGKLVWSTNLYRPGDSVHTPDQKPWALAYDASSDSIIAVFGQHGSNVYRFYSPHADLKGKTGNMYMAWVGKIDAKTGKLLTGWYFQTSRSGRYNQEGVPQPPPWPSLSGNHIGDLLCDENGYIYLVGNGGAKAWTSPGAIASWPQSQEGGGHGMFLVLDPELHCRYATLISSGVANAGGAMTSIARHGNAFLVGGKAKLMNGKLARNRMPWSMNVRQTSDHAAVLVRLSW